MSNTSTNAVRARYDVSQHAVEGGKASGAARRQRSQLEYKLRRKVVEARNGAAAYGLLRLELEREHARDQVVYAKDAELTEMQLTLLDVTEQVQQAREQLYALEVKAEARAAELARAQEDEAVLERLLRQADEAGLLESVLIRMGFEQHEVES